MHSAHEEVIRLPHETVGNVNHKRPRDGSHFEPSPRLAQHLKPLDIRGDDGEILDVSVGADAVLLVARGFLTWVMQDAGASLRAPDHGVEGVLVQVQGKGEHLGQTAGEADHGRLISAEGGFEVGHVAGPEVDFCDGRVWVVGVVGGVVIPVECLLQV